MAARLNRLHSDAVRTKIKCSQIINRLQDHIDGKVELTTSQVNAAKILLDKSLSNAPTNINAEHSGGVTFNVVTGVPVADEND